MPIPPDTRAPGDSGHVTDHNNIADALTAVTATAAAAVPQSQSFPLGNNAYRDILKWTVTGQTDDPLAPFGTVAGSQTYAEPDTTHPVQGPAFWSGYNPDLLSNRVSSAAHGAIGVSCFADAGDSNDGAGRHGLEWNVGFRSPDGTRASNAIQVIALDDNANCVNLALRCGTGSSADDGSTVVSQITFANADGSKVFATMDGVNGGTTFFEQVSLAPPSGDAILHLASANGNTFVNVAAAAGADAGFGFLENSALKGSVQWYGTPTNAFAIAGPSGTASLYAMAALTYAFVPWNFAVGLAVPLTSGAPTGAAPEGAGSVRLDPATGKLYGLCNSGWKSVTLS